MLFAYALMAATTMQTRFLTMTGCKSKDFTYRKSIWNQFKRSSPGCLLLGEQRRKKGRGLQARGAPQSFGCTQGLVNRAPTSAIKYYQMNFLKGIIAELRTRRGIGFIRQEALL